MSTHLFKLEKKTIPICKVIYHLKVYFYKLKTHIVKLRVIPKKSNSDV